jgi:hypothetical protein
MTPVAPAFAPGSDAGVSREAWLLHQERLRGFICSQSVDAQSRAEVLLQVEEAVKRASVPDWDNEGAAPVEQTTVRYATRFLWALPQGMPAPSVLVDRDGDIVFDWGSHPRHTFSVSIARDGTLAYAGLFGRARTLGKENLTEGISASLLAYIERAGR